MTTTDEGGQTCAGVRGPSHPPLPSPSQGLLEMVPTRGERKRSMVLVRAPAWLGSGPGNPSAEEHRVSEKSAPAGGNRVL